VAERGRMAIIENAKGENTISLAKEIKQKWLQNSTAFEEKLDKWLSAAQEGNKLIPHAKAKFYQPYPLRAYTAINKCKPKTKLFKAVVISLRFLGQEVANLIVPDPEAQLEITKKQLKANQKYFNQKSPVGMYNWKSSTEAKKFRKHFKRKIKEESNIKTAIPEHSYESKIICEMLKRRKFRGTLRNIAPVMIGGLPLQMPLPISGSSGSPKISNGHIDILARRNNKLSIWEVKRPGIYKDALKEAYIYTVTLLKILRSRKGKKWYKLFGFSRKLDPSLRVEAIVVLSISDRQKEVFKEKIEEYRSKMPLKVGKDLIELYLANYDKDSFAISLERL